MAFTRENLADAAESMAISLPGGTLNVRYRPALLCKSNVDRLGPDYSLAELLAGKGDEKGVLVEWDYLDDSGAAFDITPERVEDFGVLQQRIMRALMAGEKISPN